MKCILPTLLLLPILVLSQTEKGVSPISSPIGGGREGATYAVVVGISDYQDEGIPDLRFADKDAEAFANFLRSPSGGNLDGDHLKVLLNDQATAGQVGAELFWLLDETKPGDQVIIYFSGHGDVERKTISQPGYLLCWDAPARVYLGGGALALPMFQDVITTLSVTNQAKVFIIADACRSGKLAGSSVGGSQITGTNLATQYANEIKILSCQPDEYSIEGEQWGGGRGAFSYHLLDGLWGLADRNKDLSVNLMEIRGYLEEKVSAEVAPQNQMPMTIGNVREPLATVNPALLAEVQKSKKGQMALFGSTDSRGMEEELLAEVDTSVRKTYRLFKQSLKEKTFLLAPLGEPTHACADHYYEQLLKEPKLERLHATMTRNFAAALQDDAQQVVNKLLKMDQDEISLSKFNQTLKYESYPGRLQRAAELLGPAHYMYPILQARKLYFEAFLMHVDHRHPDRELGMAILAKYRESLQWQAESPHVYFEMMKVHFFQMQEADSAEYYAHLAAEKVPAWVLPYTWMGFLYLESSNRQNLDKARHFLELADQRDPGRSNLTLLNYWGLYHTRMGDFEKGEALFKEIVSRDSSRARYFGNFSLVYLSTGRFKEAIQVLKKAINVDSTCHPCHNLLGQAYFYTQQYREAEHHFRITVDLDTVSLWPRVGLVQVYIANGQFEAATAESKIIFEKDSTATWAYDNIGQSYYLIDRYQEAEQQWKKSIQINPDDHFARGYLGSLYLKTGRLEEAEQQYLIGLKISPSPQHMMCGLGWIYAKTGRYEEAHQILQEAMSSDPTMLKYTFVTYAVLYSYQQKYDQAFDYLEQALQNGYNYKDPYFIDLMKENDLAPLREKKERWEALIEKYFPDMAKN